MGDMKNLLSAVVLSMLVLFLYQTFYLGPMDELAREQEQLDQEAEVDQPLDLGGETITDPDPLSREILGEAPPEAAPPPAVSVPVIIDAARVRGSISTRGATLDNLVLKDYYDRVGEGALNINLLRPAPENNAYFARFGWRANASVELPGENTVWNARGGTLTTDNPVELYWENSQGVTFRQFFSVDENFLFTIRQVVENNSGARINIAPTGDIWRIDTPDTLGFFILHEGPVGAFNDQVEDDYDYDDLADDGPLEYAGSNNGWLGFTGKNWLTALIPDQGKSFTGNYTYSKMRGRDVYRARFLVEGGEVVAIGGRSEYTSHFFAGAKEVDLIDAYSEAYNIPKFDWAIDWGWFSFLTQPIYFTLDFFFKATGNYGVAILILTIIIKIFFFPLANKSYRAMSKMKKLQPKMKQIKERYADDKTRQQQETMALYKKEKVNPAAGCLPILLQIPVFFALYKTLFVTIDSRHQPFFGWIHDLSAPDPATLITGFGLIDWSYPGWISFLAIGIWPILMGLTMWLQMKLNPQSPDPIQAKIFMFMPILFTFILAPFPVALVIYWTWNNLLSITQQWIIMRREGVSIKDG
ncbi:MAG: membrane protein insertase YidC [Proteobacteria bacterium]|nr:membrane protein insertase YidC [Pseudomonadota bacterium]